MVMGGDDLAKAIDCVHTAHDAVKNERIPEIGAMIETPSALFQLDEILELADFIGSTAAMITYVKESPCKEFIIGTEMGIIYRLKRDNPEKKFYVPTDQFICANMKLTTLGWLARSLEQMVYEVKVPEDIAGPARKALERMLEVTS